MAIRSPRGRRMIDDYMALLYQSDRDKVKRAQKVPPSVKGSVLPRLQDDDIIEFAMMPRS